VLSVLVGGECACADESVSTVRWRAAAGADGVWTARTTEDSSSLWLAEIVDGNPALRRVVSMGELPRLMVGTESGPLLFFEARGEGEQRMYPVRRGDFTDRAGIAVTGDLVATSPLVTQHELISGASAGGRPYLLAASEHIDHGAVLYTLERGRWAEVRLPVELADASLDPSSLLLVEVDGKLGVLTGGETDESSVLWSLDQLEIAENGSDARYPASWTALELPIGLGRGSTAAVGLGDELILVTETTDGIACLVQRRQGAIRFAAFEGRRLPEAVIAHESQLWILDSDSDGEIQALVVGRNGETVAEGVLNESARRGGEDGIVLLLLVAWSVLISIMILFMQQGKQIRIVLPPRGFAMAEPSRRLFAALIDLLPGMVLVSLIFGKPLAWWLSPLHEIIAADGSMPIFTLAWLTFGYLTLADGLTGRTLGRLATGCRVMTEDGKVPGLRRAAARSFLKVFCPPLVVLLVLMPYAPAPWSFGTVVVRQIADDPKQGSERDGE
jgi:uncharacterized RDD family membrane protein YckC